MLHTWSGCACPLAQEQEPRTWEEEIKYQQKWITNKGKTKHLCLKPSAVCQAILASKRIHTAHPYRASVTQERGLRKKKGVIHQINVYFLFSSATAVAPGSREPIPIGKVSGASLCPADSSVRFSTLCSRRYSLFDITAPHCTEWPGAVTAHWSSPSHSSRVFLPLSSHSPQGYD